MNVLTDVPMHIRESFFGSPKNLYRRHWSLFWCKMGKSPQSYILFAESGVGIPSFPIWSTDAKPKAGGVKIKLLMAKALL
jgi:hypothetical protein